MNQVTQYIFDAAGNLIAQTDPSGFSTSITPNAANLPETTVHRDENQNVTATTTNTYSNANELQSATTTDPTYNLTVTNERTYNGNGYVQTANASYTRDTYGGTTTSSLGYKDNNLLGTLTQQGYADNHYLYNSAGRLVCSEWGGTALEYLVYEGNQRQTRYRNPGATCETLGTDPEAFLINAWGYRKTTYTYNGTRLIRDEGFYCMPGCALNPTPTYTRTFGYDGDGNLNQLTLVTEGATTTLVYDWEPGTHHLRSVTKNGSVVGTFEYDRLDRIRKFCTSSTGNCHVFSYLGDSDWVSTVRDEVGNLRYRYLYANGRPLRVDIPYVWWVNPWYFVYTARGDWAGFVDREKSNALGWKWSYGAWGDMSYQDGAYYTWNAEWGYMQFPSNLIAVPGDVLEGFYYAHGRWYMADIGLWLSPNETGEYVYSETRQDPLNVAAFPCPPEWPWFLRWLCDGGETTPVPPIPTPGMTPTLTEVLKTRTPTSTPLPTPTWDEEDIRNIAIIATYEYTYGSDDEIFRAIAWTAKNRVTTKLDGVTSYRDSKLLNAYDAWAVHKNDAPDPNALRVTRQVITQETQSQDPLHGARFFVSHDYWTGTSKVTGDTPLPGEQYSDVDVQNLINQDAFVLSRQFRISNESIYGIYFFHGWPPPVPPARTPTPGR